MSGVLGKLFGAPKKSPEEQAREWKRQLTAESRAIERQMWKIQREEKKVQMAAKKAAKDGDTPSVRILSREILHARKACKRLLTAKTHMSSIAMQLQQQMSQLKVVGSIERSAAIMGSMNELVRVSEVGMTMQAMSREMTKAGLIDEMVADTLDSALDDDVGEDELDDEVAKVVQDVMQDAMKGTRVRDEQMPVREPEPEPAVAEDDEDDELMAKYAALQRA